MKKIILLLLSLPLAGCVTPYQQAQLRAVQMNCRAIAAGQAGYYGAGQNGMPAGNPQLYAADYYACYDREKAAWLGMPRPYYPYPYYRPYPGYGYPGYDGPAAGAGFGVGVR